MPRFGRPGLLGTMARTAVIAGTATEVAGAVSNHNEQRAMQQQAAQQYAPPPPPPPAPAAPSSEGESTVISQLKDLADLKAQGVLTDEEFAAQKAKILAGA